ncbi:MAG: isopenicillin N-epimerase [Pseudomonadota bacterium]|jgi:isopenicillin-N epimerase
MWKYGAEKIRGCWDLDVHTAFLNHGSYGAVPRQVQNEYHAVQLEIERNPVRFLGRLLPARLASVRERIAGWLRCDADGLAFVNNATSGVGAVLNSLPFHALDEIIFHNHGYGWVRQGLHNLARSKGIVIREAAIKPVPSSNSEIVSAFATLVNEKTRLIVCDHVTSPTALVFPVREIVALARQAGVPVLVDGAHAPALLPLDLSSIGADFYTGNFHKWLCAPRGAAFLHVLPRWREIIRPQSICYSSGITHHAYDTSFTGYFDWTGTSDFASWLTVPAALDFHEALDWQRVFSERKRLLCEALQLYSDAFPSAVESLPEVNFLAAMVTLPLKLKEGIVADALLARSLTDDFYSSDKVEVPAVSFQGRMYVRLSAQIYNRLEDVERLLRVVGSHRFSAVRVGVR